jgi:hypothetical protein
MRKEIWIRIESELESAMNKYPRLHSNHEGWAVIREEVDELWDRIKESKSTKADDFMKLECIQIAAMAVRFIIDLS